MLESAQAALGIAQRDYLPVQFIVQPSILSEVGRFAPTLLIIGFFFILSRGMGAQMGGGPGGGLFNVGKSKAVKATKVSACCECHAVKCHAAKCHAECT